MFHTNPDGTESWVFESVPFGYSSYGSHPGSGEFGADPGALSQTTREQWEKVPGHPDWDRAKIPSGARLSVFIETVTITQEILPVGRVNLLKRSDLLAQYTVGLPNSDTGYRSDASDTGDLEYLDTIPDGAGYAYNRYVDGNGVIHLEPTEEVTVIARGEPESPLPPDPRGRGLQESIFRGLGGTGPFVPGPRPTSQLDLLAGAYLGLIGAGIAAEGVGVAALAGAGRVVGAGLRVIAPYARVAVPLAAPFLVKSSYDVEGHFKLVEIGFLGVEGPPAAIAVTEPSALGISLEKAVTEESLVATSAVQAEKLKSALAAEHVASAVPAKLESALAGTEQEASSLLREAAAGYRDVNRIKDSRNVGASIFEIDGELVDLNVKVSGPPLSEIPVLEAKVVKYLRTTDAEYQLVHDFVSRYPTSSRGTLHIYTERLACESCSELPGQIEAIFPNVKVKLVPGPHSW